MEDYLRKARLAYHESMLMKLKTSFAKHQAPLCTSNFKQTNGRAFAFFCKCVEQILIDNLPEERGRDSTQSLCKRSMVVLKVVSVIGNIAVVAGIVLLSWAFLRSENARFFLRKITSHILENKFFSCKKDL